MIFKYAEQGNGFLAELSYSQQKKLNATSLGKTIPPIKKSTKTVTDKVTDKVTDNLSENQLEIIRLMKKNSFITTIEIADKLKISQRKVKENIGKLKEKGFVKRIGSAKGGHWETVTNGYL